MSTLRKSVVKIIFNILFIYLQLEYGEDVWKQAMTMSGYKFTVFSTHQVYSDMIMPSLASSLAKITSKSYESFMMFFGKCFVRFFSNYG